jgi:hypothetical protein
VTISSGSNVIVVAPGSELTWDGADERRAPVAAGSCTRAWSKCIEFTGVDAVGQRPGAEIVPPVSTASNPEVAGVYCASSARTTSALMTTMARVMMAVWVGML